MAAEDEVQHASACYPAALTPTQKRHVGPVALGAAALACVGMASSLLGAPTETSAAPFGVRPFQRVSAN